MNRERGTLGSDDRPLRSGAAAAIELRQTRASTGRYPRTVVVPQSGGGVLGGLFKAPPRLTAKPRTRLEVGKTKPVLHRRSSHSWSSAGYLLDLT
jgi:hypothetical protein